MKATCKQCGIDEPDHRPDCHHGLFARLAMTAAVVRDQEDALRRLRDHVKRLEDAEIARASCCALNEQRADKAEATLRALGIASDDVITRMAKAIADGNQHGWTYRKQAHAALDAFWEGRDDE